jgi:LacI family transcriptional regulator
MRKTLKDVAALADVSSATASLALNGHSSRVSADVIERVQRAAKSLNYQPNLLARGLRTQETKTIGFISDVVATTPFAGQMIAGAQEHAWSKGWLLLLIDTNNNPSLEAAAIDALHQRRVDGFIYASMFHRIVKIPKGLVGRQVVLLDCTDEPKKSRVDSVIPNEYEGAMSAMRLLLSQGHRRIGHVTSREVGVATVERLRAYKNALAEAKIPFDASLVAYSASADAPDGYDGAVQIFANKKAPTAVFCYTDRMAMGVYEFAQENGLSIPRDLSVIGFDDQPFLANALRPALTTVRLPHYEMGSWASERLINLVNDEDSDSTKPMRNYLQCPLVERESVAPPGS